MSNTADFTQGQHSEKAVPVHAAGARRTDSTGGLRRGRPARCRTLRFDLGSVGGLDRQSGAQSRDIRRDAACDGRYRADRAVYRRKTRKGDRRGARRRGRRVHHSRRLSVRAARAVRTADLGAHAGTAGVRSRSRQAMCASAAAASCSSLHTTCSRRCSAVWETAVRRCCSCSWPAWSMSQAIWCSWPVCIWMRPVRRFATVLAQAVSVGCALAILRRKSCRLRSERAICGSMSSADAFSRSVCRSPCRNF